MLDAGLYLKEIYLNMADSKKKVALLSNVTVDLIIGKLRREYDFYLPEGFDTWVQEAINPSAGFIQQSRMQ